MSITVHFLGTGSALPKLGANPSCQYVFCENRHFLVDCGEGAQIQLRKYGVKYQNLQQIFISHLHGDHFFGLVGLLSTMHLLGRQNAIHIYGPPELEGIVRSQLELGHARLSFEMNFISIEPKFEGVLYEDKVIEVSTFCLKHKIPTHGFIFKEKVKPRTLIGTKFKESGLSIKLIEDLKAGKDVLDDDGNQINHLDYTTDPPPSGSYAYCTDTAYSLNVVNKIQGVHTVYHEATFLLKDADRAKSTLHSTTISAAKVANEANIQHLYFGHMSARYDTPIAHLEEMRAEFPKTNYAAEGLVIQIP